MASQPLGRARKISAAGGKSPAGDASRQTRPAAARRRVTTQLKLPIAFKFATFIAVLTVASMAWLSWKAIQTGGDQLEKEINDLGIHLVLSLSTLLDPEVVRAQDRDALEERLEEFCRRRGTEKVRAVVIYPPLGTDAIAAVNALRLTEAEPIRYPPAERAQVRITELEVDRTPVRSFSTLIHASGYSAAETGNETPRFPPPPPPLSPADPGEVIGRVDLFLDAAEIGDSRRALSRTLTRISIVACLVATVAAFLLASYLTRSIRTLVKDMRQVSQGDLQHQSGVNSGDELGDLARTFNVMTSNLQTAQAVKLAKKAMEHELRIAESIQTRLLPAGTPKFDRIDLATFYLSAKEVGGDYYDFVTIDEEHLGIVVADVSGKGVPGSLIMTMTRSLLRLAAAGVVAPSDTVRQVNRCLTPDMNPGMFVTLLYVVLNTVTREIRLVRAGHTKPYLFSARHGKLVCLEPAGIAIGLDRTRAVFDSELEVQRFTLRNGDILVAYTDGVIEGKNRDGEDFGEERLARLVKENHQRTAQELVDKVVEALQDHQEGTEQSDDITLVALRAT